MEPLSDSLAGWKDCGTNVTIFVYHLKDSGVLDLSKRPSCTLRSSHINNKCIYCSLPSTSDLLYPLPVALSSTFYIHSRSLPAHWYSRAPQYHTVIRCGFGILRGRLVGRRGAVGRLHVQFGAGGRRPAVLP